MRLRSTIHLHCICIWIVRVFHPCLYRNDPIHVPPEALKTRFGVFQTIIREIHARHGMPGYYRGYWISICTYAPNSALWWGFYHWYIDALSKILPSSVTALMVQTCSAPAAGLSAAVLTNPIDVVRARVQVIPDNRRCTCKYERITTESSKARGRPKSIA